MDVVGALEPVGTFVTNYAIYPFVGLIEPGTEWVPQAREVAEVLEFPLARCAPAHGEKRLVRKGIPFRTDTYEVGDAMIWGATARIVADLLSGLLDRDVDQVAPLGPRAVVVLDVLLPEQLVQHEPRVRRALADPAVGDDRRRRR